MPQEIPHAKEHLILAAARKRFAYYGYSKVTMDEIAADVGLAKPSLYYYYPTKESLFRSVITAEHVKFVQDINLMMKRPMPTCQKLKEYTALRARLFRELANLSALGIQSWAELSTLSGDLFKSLEEQELKFLHTILLEGKSAGELELANPLQAARLLLHLMQGLRFRMLRPEREPPFDEESFGDLKRDMELLMDLLMKGIQRHTPH